MVDWLIGIASGFGWFEVSLALGLFVLTFVASLAIVALLLVRIPADFFVAKRRGERRRPATVLAWIRRIAKNALGAAVILLGFMLSLPGIPGQGLLTILIGVMLLEFPGKRRLERKIVGRPRILRAVNRLRARYGRPPLVLDKSCRQPRSAE